MLVWILIILAAVALDQITKLLAVIYLAPDGSVDVIKNVFRFTYVENRGAAFGMLSDSRWVFMIFSVIAIVALFIYLWKFRPESKLACTSIAFIISGGIGNMIDRVFRGFVVDFFDFCAFPNIWMWVFNVADVFVCVGGAILMLWLVVSLVQEYKSQQNSEQKNDSSDKENKS